MCKLMLQLSTNRKMFYDRRCSRSSRPGWLALAEQCMMTYGVRPRIHWITTEFGGKRIELVLKRFGCNIIFSNGMQDPWSRGGVLKNLSASIIALVTKKGAHHVDFRSKTKDDPDWLVELRRQEVEIIQKWVG